VLDPDEDPAVDVLLGDDEDEDMVVTVIGIVSEVLQVRLQLKDPDFFGW
jgi:hypothetical protein